MIVRRTTRLEAPAPCAWELIQRVDTFFYVSRGLLGFRIDQRPAERFVTGARYRGRLWFAHVVPGWRHELHVIRVDPARREIYTHESGGPLRTWNHCLRVEGETATSSLYTDEIEFDAGRLTSPTRIVVELFFRYRQARLRRLARSARASQLMGTTRDKNGALPQL